MAQPYWLPDLNANSKGLQWNVFNSTARCLLVSGPRYSGKCTDENTLILANGAFRRFGSIGKGMFAGEFRPSSHAITSLDVETSSLKPACATSVYHDPCTEGLSVTTASGYQLRASAWHPLWTCCDGKFDYRTTTEIADLIASGKSIAVPLVKNTRLWDATELHVFEFDQFNRSKKKWAEIHGRIKSAIEVAGPDNWNRLAKLANTSWATVRGFFKQERKRTRYSVTITEGIGYMLGLLIGDGCLTNITKKKCMSFSSEDAPLIAFLRSILAREFDGKVVHSEGCDWYLRSDKLKSFVIALGCDKYAHEKIIPDCIIESPKTVVRAFLRGLFDTDGTADKYGRVSYCSSSEHLARDVHQLLLAFGIRSSIRFKNNNRRGAWLVDVFGDSGIFYKNIGFGLLRKHSRYLLLQEKKRGRMAYPESIRPLLKCLYLSRHERGAIKGNLPRSKRHAGYDAIYSSNGCCVSEETLANFMEFASAKNDPELRKYWIDGDVFWEVVRSVTHCPVKLYDLVVPGPHNFVANGFVNHNTIAVLHKIIRHMYDTPGASVAMFSKTMKNSKEGGTWLDLHRYILPEWIGANIGLQYTTLNNEGNPGWKVQGDTRTPYFKISNRYSGESECRLFSLDHVPDVVDKVKEQRFSLIYFSELMKFDDRIVLSATMPCLRMMHLRTEDQQWIADTNPSEEGEDSWIYKLWYQERVQTYEDYAAACVEDGRVPDSENDFNVFQRGLELIELFPEDNVRLDPNVLSELKRHCAYDKGLYDRDVKGLWVYGDGDQSRHFRSFFKPERHVLGDVDSPNEDEWELINPHPSSVELIGGIDPGDVNQAAVLLDETLIGGKKHFSVIEEFESIKQELSIDDFTVSIMEAVKILEKAMNKQYDLTRFYSDASAFKYNATADTFPALQVQSASDGRIALIGVPKPKGSVRIRVKLVKQLLAEGRLKISAHCEAVIRMLRDLKKGKGIVNYVVPDHNKHIFDALTYPLIMECAEELLTWEDRVNIDRRQPSSAVMVAA